MARKQEPLFFRIFSSKIFFVFVLILSIYLATNLYKELQQRRRVKNEINNLKSQIDSIEKQNSDLKNLISYFETDEYVESFSREKLGFKKSGETVIVFSKEEEVQSITNQDNEKLKVYENIKSWWAYFFSNNNQ